MSQIHQRYNFLFANEIFRSHVYKTCELININANPSYVNLSTYLLYLQFIENINEFALPEIEKFLNGLPYDNISQETVEIVLGQMNVEIRWNSTTETVPMNDFKDVLKEYADFLQAPPLDGLAVCFWRALFGQILNSQG
ncbi:hypothetical protein ABIB62_003298 [Mucilaginibacter sp. UYP25]|uniref:hypothetical protein n=1 Tax=unclassified Mucilaginibacter TaxID=2617802 RepID=UPI0033999FCB